MAKKSTGRPAPKLNDEARTFVVTQLAAFDTPSMVAKAVKEEFGFELSVQAVHCYDPTKKAGATLAKKWATLFHETRKAFVDGKAQIGIANKQVRLHILDQLIQKSRASGNAVLTGQLLEQAAKESGDAYSNRHKVEHAAPNGLALLLGSMGRSSLPIKDE